MSITKILAAKDVEAEAKLTAVAKVVAGARKKYGNTDADVPAPMCETVNGRMNFNHLEADSKVALLAAEIQKIKARAIEFVGQTTGAVMNKKIEELLSCNGYFANVDAGTQFDYV